MARKLSTDAHLKASQIQQECVRRGWNQADLAQHAKLSRPTISLAFRGGVVTARTASRIWGAFAEHPPKLDGLLRRSA